MTDADFSPLDGALEAVRRGWAVFPVDHPEAPNCMGAHRRMPCDGDRGKHPCTAWGSDVCRTESEVYATFTGRLRNYGINCAESHLVVLDEDAHGEMERLCADYGQQVPDTFRVLTAKGGHYYFAAPEGTPIGNETVLKALEYKIDVRGHGGFVVGAGSQHKTGVHYVYADREADVAPLPQFLAEMFASGSRPGQSGRQAPGTGHGPGPQDDPLDAVDKRWWLTGPIKDGTRDNALIAAAGWCRAVNLDEQAAWLVVRDVWQRCEQPPLARDVYTEDMARAKLSRAYSVWEPRDPFGDAGGRTAHGAQSGQDEPANPDQLDMLVEQFQARTKSTAQLRDQPPPKWLIGGLVTEGSLAQVFGKSGSFKSFYVLDMALCIATNTTFHGRDVHGGPVYYVAAEGAGGLAQRVRAWEKTYAIDVPDVGADGGVRWVDWALQLTSGTEYAALRESAKREKPAAIFLDTRARVSVGLNENDAQDTGLLVQRLGAISEDTGAALILVHHTGHGDQDRGRGSSAAYAALDAEIKIERRGKSPYVTVEGTKGKDWGEAEAETFEFAIVEVPVDTDPMATSGVLRRTDALIDDQEDAPPLSVEVIEDVWQRIQDGRPTVGSEVRKTVKGRVERVLAALEAHVRAGRLAQVDGRGRAKPYVVTEKGSKWLLERRPDLTSDWDETDE